MNTKYIMIQDIIDAENITSERLKGAMRTCYFRGLSHCDNKKEILSKSFAEALAEIEEKEIYEI